MWARAATVLVSLSLGCGPGEEADDTGPDDTGPAAAREVTSDDGRLVLYLPEGALSEDVEITATALDVEALNAEGADPPWLAAYDLQPPGLQFLEPVVMTIAMDTDVLDEIGGIPGIILQHETVDVLSVGLAVEGETQGQLRMVARVDDLGATSREAGMACTGVIEEVVVTAEYRRADDGLPSPVEADADEPAVMKSGELGELLLRGTAAHDVLIDGMRVAVQPPAPDLERIEILKGPQGALPAATPKALDPVVLRGHGLVPGEHAVLPTLHTERYPELEDLGDPAWLYAAGYRVEVLPGVYASGDFTFESACPPSDPGYESAAYVAGGFLPTERTYVTGDITSGVSFWDLSAREATWGTPCAIKATYAGTIPPFTDTHFPLLALAYGDARQGQVGLGVVAGGEWEKLYATFDPTGWTEGTLTLSPGLELAPYTAAPYLGLRIQNLSSEGITVSDWDDDASFDLGPWEVAIEGQSLAAGGNISLATSYALEGDSVAFDASVIGDLGGIVGVPQDRGFRSLDFTYSLGADTYYGDTDAAGSGGDCRLFVDAWYKLRGVGDVPMPDRPMVWSAGAGWVVSDFETGVIDEDQSDGSAALWTCEMFVDENESGAGASMYCGDASGGRANNVAPPDPDHGEPNAYWGWTQVSGYAHRITDVSAYPTGEGATWRVPYGLWANATTRTLFRIELDTFYTPPYFKTTYAVGDTFYFGTSTPFSADLVDPDTMVLVTEGDADGDPKGRVGWYTLEDSAITWGDEIGDVRRIREHGGYVGITTFTDQSFFYGTWDETNGVQIAGSVDVGVDLVHLEVTDLDGETVALFAGGTKVFVWHFATATLDTHDTPCEAVTSASKVWNRTAVVHNCQDDQGDWTLIPLAL